MPRIVDQFHRHKEAIMSAQPERQQSPEVQPTPAQERATALIERIAEDVRQAPEDYLRDTEVPEGGE